MIKIKRVYEASSEEDGFRILIDRLWPRGLSKKSAQIDAWLKDIAPSDNLRKWFSHDPKKWTEFKKRYHKELEEKKDIISKIKSLEKEKKTITFLYSAKDKEHNNAVFLQGYIQK
ncbi:MAG: DUF488 domain-containing protein [Nitrosotalea sp.]